MRDEETIVVVTCEHATNHVPGAYAHLFSGNEGVLNSHRGYDIGAIEAAHQISGALNAHLFVGEASRLLVELNRSPENPQLWSEFTEPMDHNEKAHLMDRYYFFYRKTVESYIDRAMALGLRVLHLSIHSFTPMLDGVAREVDIGVLFDPSRNWERLFSERWLNDLSVKHPHLMVRPNEPYSGKDDGFTTYLRSRLPQKRYAGIELEIKNTLEHSQFSYEAAAQSITRMLS